MTQVKKTWDKVSIKKALKGLAIAATGGAALAALAFIGDLDLSKYPLVAAIIVVIVPAGVNAVKEWMKGK